MSAELAPREVSVPARRSWVLAGVAVLAWLFLYRVNGPFWNWLLFHPIGLHAETRLGETIRFFVFDTTKILLLLTGIIFVVTVLRSFLSVERSRGSSSVGGARGSRTSRPRCSASRPRSARAARCRRSSGSSPRACRSA